MRTPGEDVILRALTESVEAWEEGRAASPSPLDFVLIANRELHEIDLLGPYLVIDKLSDELESSDEIEGDLAGIAAWLADRMEVRAPVVSIDPGTSPPRVSLDLRGK